MDEKWEQQIVEARSALEWLVFLNSANFNPQAVAEALRRIAAEFDKYVDDFANEIDVNKMFDLLTGNLEVNEPDE
jgi:DNA-binding GntR family transcriptional regulator